MKLGPVGERLQALSGRRSDKARTRLVAEAIRLDVEREGEIERASAETRERLARYDTTGEHIANEDVQAWWLKTWGTPNDSSCPLLICEARMRRRLRSDPAQFAIRLTPGVAGLQERGGRRSALPNASSFT